MALPSHHRSRVRVVLQRGIPTSSTSRPARQWRHMPPSLNLTSKPRRSPTSSTPWQQPKIRCVGFGRFALARLGRASRRAELLSFRPRARRVAPLSSYPHSAWMSCISHVRSHPRARFFSFLLLVSSTSSQNWNRDESVCETIYKTLYVASTASTSTQTMCCSRTEANFKTW